MKTQVLYLSYDGMTDPLGQSQVLPYLAGLTKAGYSITLVSFEKKEKFEATGKATGEQIKSLGIDWQPLSYTPKPPVLSTLWDIYQLRKKAEELHKQKNFKIVHCRSYITSLVGEFLKKKYGIKFIFDMRAFFADERVDGGLWNRSNPIFNRVYLYFKKKEQDFLENADYTVSLTQAGKEIIHSWKHLKNQPVRVEVIPCCADLEHFSKTNIEQNQLSNYRTELGITENDFVVSYLGSVGTWYLPDEMLSFFKRLLLKKPGAKFLFITGDNPSEILDRVEKLNIPKDKFIIRKATRNEVPYFILLSKFSLFFIQPLFSKKGSSPTKHGEILGMEIPVVCNSGVGDVDRIVRDTQSGLLIDKLNDAEYDKVISQLDSLLQTPPEKLRAAAEKYYSLEEGVKKYLAIYNSLSYREG
ncbi:MAG: D-inositol-3-phosphate glycosyltransferase [Bacteroidia bacterium]|nr:D-inositol-3-phosphate glycosyltransferase [Bacteroidia bacterium]